MRRGQIFTQDLTVSFIIFFTVILLMINHVHYLSYHKDRMLVHNSLELLQSRIQSTLFPSYSLNGLNFGDYEDLRDSLALNREKLSYDVFFLMDCGGNISEYGMFPTGSEVLSRKYVIVNEGKLCDLTVSVGVRE